jgi:hypothetical protein
MHWTRSCRHWKGEGKVAKERKAYADEEGVYLGNSPRASILFLASSSAHVWMLQRQLLALCDVEGANPSSEWSVMATACMRIIPVKWEARTWCRACRR